LIRLALAKLEFNEKKYLGEKFPDLDEEEELDKETSKEIAINKCTWNITENYILEKVLNEGSILYTDTLNACVMLCKQKTGHGANITIRRHIDALTSVTGPYEIKRDSKNKKVIVKRDS